MRKDYGEFFVTGKRPDGSTFIKLQNGSPAELQDLVRSIHGVFECLPCDWIYSKISEAFDDLQDNSIDNVNPESDCYFSQLYKWFGEPFAAYYVDLYMADFPSTTSIWDAISGGQYLAIDFIYREVDRFIQEGGQDDD